MGRFGKNYAKNYANTMHSKSTRAYAHVTDVHTMAGEQLLRVQAWTSYISRGGCADIPLPTVDAVGT